ncbi:hypothetical protein MP228_004782 [Amoeboaphelidium protococcarum]|nr:hypothetical protein MP228_004782 [Amoeboaphelidium protococcarum]
MKYEILISAVLISQQCTVQSLPQNNQNKKQQGAWDNALHQRCRQQSAQKCWNCPSFSEAMRSQCQSLEDQCQSAAKGSAQMPRPYVCPPKASPPPTTPRQPATNPSPAPAPPKPQSGQSAPSPGNSPSYTQTQPTQKAASPKAPQPPTAPNPSPTPQQTSNVAQPPAQMNFLSGFPFFSNFFGNGGGDANNNLPDGQPAPITPEQVPEQQSPDVPAPSTPPPVQQGEKPEGEEQQQQQQQQEQEQQQVPNPDEQPPQDQQPSTPTPNPPSYPEQQQAGNNGTEANRYGKTRFPTAEESGNQHWFGHSQCLDKPNASPASNLEASITWYEKSGSPTSCAWRPGKINGMAVAAIGLNYWKKNYGNTCWRITPKGRINQDYGGKKPEADRQIVSTLSELTVVIGDQCPDEGLWCYFNNGQSDKNEVGMDVHFDLQINSLPDDWVQFRARTNYNVYASASLITCPQ